MRIKTLEIRNFGKLAGLTLNLGEGMNKGNPLRPERGQDCQRRVAASGKEV